MTLTVGLKKPGISGDWEGQDLTLPVWHTDVTAAAAAPYPSAKTVTGTAKNDRLVGDFASVRHKLVGGAGNDTLIGNRHDDTLSGGLGADVMSGGAGNDVYYVDNARDRIVDTSGTDRVISSVSYTLTGLLDDLELTGRGNLRGVGNVLSNELYGNAGANVLIGGAGYDTLVGGAGNDTLSGGFDVDVLSGGAGNDVYYVDHFFDRTVDTSGTDRVISTVSYTLIGSLEHLDLTGTGNLRGVGNSLANMITGNAGANVLSGEAGNDTLIGGAGSDTLDGWSGADIMSGGLGGDEYWVDNAGDRVFDLEGGGADTVISSINYTLTGGVENLDLTGSARIGAGNSLGNRITDYFNNSTLKGEAGNDTLIGGWGFNILSGGTGADHMSGGSGNDVYYVDNAGDRIYETAPDFDTVYVSADVTIYANVESIILSGTEGLKVTNASSATNLQQSFVGNSGHNYLRSFAGTDLMTGGAGNDTLLGGSGDDSLSGGNGNDTLQGEDGGDLLTGDAGDDYLMGGKGTDTIYGGDGNDTISDLNGLETGFFEGGAGDDLFIIQGSSVSIDGDSGNDTIKIYSPLNPSSSHFVVFSGDGDDVVSGSVASDFVSAGNGNDMISGAAGDDNLFGDAGADTIFAGSGNDEIDGGLGNDLIEAGDGDDMISDTGGNDIISGGNGSDTLSGGTGADVYVYTAISESTALSMDVIIFDANGDSLQFSGLETGTFDFKGDAVLTNTGNSQASFNDTTDILTVDTDGDGTVDMTIMLSGVSLANLSNADFVWS